jgi:excisionase family DNA binding protein
MLKVGTHHPTVVYYKTHQVAKMLGVTKRAVNKWVAAGKIPVPAKTPTGHYRWTLTDMSLIHSYLRGEQK